MALGGSAAHVIDSLSQCTQLNSSAAAPSLEALLEGLGRLSTALQVLLGRQTAMCLADLYNLEGMLKCFHDTIKA